MNGKDEFLSQLHDIAKGTDQTRDKVSASRDYQITTTGYHFLEPSFTTISRISSDNCET